MQLQSPGILHVCEIKGLFLESRVPSVLWVGLKYIHSWDLSYPYVLFLLFWNPWIPKAQFPKYVKGNYTFQREFSGQICLRHNIGDTPLLEIHNAVCFGLDCVPPWEKICWSLNPQGLRMWLYKVFTEIIKLKWGHIHPTQSVRISWCLCILQDPKLPFPTMCRDLPSHLLLLILHST